MGSDLDTAEPTAASGPSRARVIPWVVAGAIASGLLRHLAGHPAPPPIPAPSGDTAFGLPLPTRHRIFEAFLDAADEAQASAERFDDPWSRQDDLFNQFRKRTRVVCKQFSIDPSQAYLVFDEGVRSGWASSNRPPIAAQTPPLRPRIR